MNHRGALEGKARAKINLDLRVLDRRPDGYHNIRTLFARIALHDSIVVERIPRGVQLQVHGNAGGAHGAENLAHRAVTSLQDRLGRTDGVRIKLTKRIPTGAGLGGGSADAAATLRLVNELWGAPLSKDDLKLLAATLGADVPFLTSDCSVAWGAGKGDELTPAHLPNPATVLLAMPSLHVGTAEAYRRLGKYRADVAAEVDVACPQIPLADWRPIAANCMNDFEPPVHAWHPELAVLLRALASSGAFMARMSGSGAAHYALFEDPTQAWATADALRASHPQVRFLVSHFE